MKIDFTLRLVTPAYAGGAEQGKTDGIRPPIVKALLRFWWRTMNGKLTSEELFKQEAEIFGGSDKGQGVRIVPRGPLLNKQPEPTGIKADSLLDTYLGYGAVAWDKDKKFPATQCPRLPAKCSARFRVCCRDHEAFEQISKTLWLFAAFGTLGRRARKGWGSVVLEELKWDAQCFRNPADATSEEDLLNSLADGLRSIFPHKHARLPEFSAFSMDSRVYLGSSVASWENALKQVCDDYHSYHRLLGACRNHGSITGPDFRQRAGWLHQHGPTEYERAPYGSAFGLPHNAYFSSSKTKVDVGVSRDLSGRRAAPVLFKILRYGPAENHMFIPVMIWLPAVFLPETQVIYARAGDGPTVPLTQPDDKAIREFIEGTDNSNTYPLTNSLTGKWSGLVDKDKGWKEVTW